MSFRLDEGNGCCIYRIGVEDDGCHSLMDYNACAETAKVLECLARSLNAVVLERKMIQKEVVRTSDGAPIKNNGSEGKQQQENGNHIDGIITVLEPSLLGDGREHYNVDHHHFDRKDVNNHHDFEEEKSKQQEESPEEEQQLDKSPGVPTRCELTIQRVETHLLDPSPISMTNYSSSKDTTDKSNGCSTKEWSGSPSTGKPKNETLSVGETMASRNIRVAVVGNVDAGKSTMIGTLISSCLDDGRGSSRTTIMKHRHEIESGRTSTATTHLMGFRSTGEAIAGKDSVRARRKSEDEVARESYRVVTLMDLAGHEKYLKTT
jgi:hypothetical protein